MTLTQITYELLTWLANAAAIGIVVVIILIIALRIIRRTHNRRNDE